MPNQKIHRAVEQFARLALALESGRFREAISPREALRQLGFAVQAPIEPGPGLTESDGSINVGPAKSESPGPPIGEPRLPQYEPGGLGSDSTPMQGLGQNPWN